MRRLAVFTMLAIGMTGLGVAQQPTPKPDQIDTSRPEKDHKDVEAIYGKIKEVKSGQKIVIDIDKGPDKTYNLADTKKTVRIAEGLAIGDSVKVLESDSNGNHSVQIVRDTVTKSRSSK